MKPLAPAVSPLHALHSRATLDAALEDAEPVSRVRLVLEDDDQDEDDELVAWMREQVTPNAMRNP